MNIIQPQWFLSVYPIISLFDYFSTVSSVSDNPLLSPLKGFGAPSQSSYGEHQSRSLIYHLRHSLALIELSLRDPVISRPAELAVFPSALLREGFKSAWLYSKECCLWDPRLFTTKKWFLGQGFQEEGFKLRQWKNDLECWIYVTGICIGRDLFKSSVHTVCSLLIFRMIDLISLLYK